MNKRTEEANRKQVEQDLVDADARYDAGLREAAEAAEQMAEDTERAAAARVAAAETARALRVVEDARKRAESEPKPEAARRTFFQTLEDWLGGKP